MAEMTVLMSVFNENRIQLKQSIESILNQTFKDFEFIIIIDNPEHLEAIEIITAYAREDTRIKFFINKSNIGLPLTLNSGIAKVNSRYLARMDADDVSLETRLEKQYIFLEENPSVSLVGTNVTYMDEHHQIIRKRLPIPVDSESIKEHLKLTNVMNHPTFMGRTHVFQKYLYRNLQYSQDYDFVCRLVESGEIVANLSEHLLLYRVSDRVSDNKKIRQRVTMGTVQKMYCSGKLCLTDIQDLVEEQLKEVNEDKLLNSLVVYDKFVDEMKSGNKLRAIKLLLSDAIFSSYQRQNIINMIRLLLIKKKDGKFYD